MPDNPIQFDQRGGEDRRSGLTCGNHEGFIIMIATVSAQMKIVLENQKEVFDRLNETSAQLTDVKRIVSNGMSDKIEDVCEEMREVCETMKVEREVSSEACGKIKDRVETLEEFSWFRNSMTQIRDNLFWCTLKGIILLVLILASLNLTNELVKDGLAKLLTLFK